MREYGDSSESSFIFKIPTQISCMGGGMISVSLFRHANLQII